MLFQSSNSDITCSIETAYLDGMAPSISTQWLKTKSGSNTTVVDEDLLSDIKIKVCGSSYSQTLSVATIADYDAITCTVGVDVGGSVYISSSDEGEAVIYLAAIAGLSINCDSCVAS